MGFSYVNDNGELVMARFTELQPNDRIADWYAHNEVWGSPNIDSSHRCILRCPQCLRQKKEGGPRIKRAYDLETKDFQKTNHGEEGSFERQHLRFVHELPIQFLCLLEIICPAP